MSLAARLVLVTASAFEDSPPSCRVCGSEGLESRKHCAACLAEKKALQLGGDGAV